VPQLKVNKNLIICEEYESCVTGPSSFEMFDLLMVQCHKIYDILTD
jgi:hypothetical protein